MPAAKAQQRGMSFAEIQKTAFSYTSIKDYVRPKQIALRSCFWPARADAIPGQAISFWGDTQMLG